MKIQADQLIALFRQALGEGWGYIWGGRGQTWTEAKQRAATREQTIKWGKKWIGKRVADCSGLFVWAFGQLGAPIYHGSNTIWRGHLSAKGSLKNGCRLDGRELKPGTAVFLVKNGNRHHIGLYVGDGKVIEAKGTYYGVVQSSVSAWDEWGELKAVDYGEPQEGGVQEMETIRKGMRGETVLKMQEYLDTLGYELGAIDGICGAKTVLALQRFQMDNVLKADGICGVQTWEALEKAMDKIKTDEGPAETETKQYATREEFEKLVERVTALENKNDTEEMQ